MITSDPSLNHPHPWRRRWGLFAMLTAALLGAALFVHRIQKHSNDFKDFHRLWSAGWQREEIRKNLDGSQRREWIHDRYPPTFSVLFAPLGLLGLRSAGLAWYLLNVACSVGIWRLTIQLLPTPARGRARYGLAVAAVLPFWIDNLVLGQNAPLLIFLVLLAYRWAQKQRSTCAGALLGMAAAIKLFPAIFLIPFLVRRDWRAMLGFCGAIGFLVLVVNSLFFGPQLNWEVHARWWESMTASETQVANAPHAEVLALNQRFPLRYNNQSLGAVLGRLILPVNAGRLSEQFQVNVVSSSVWLWQRIHFGATAILLIVGLGALMGMCAATTELISQPSRQPSSAIAGSTRARELAMVCLLLLLVSPIVWTHYYLWLFFPLAFCNREFPGRQRAAIVTGSLWLAADLSLASPHARAYGVHLWLTLATWLWMAAPDCWHALQAACRRLDTPSQRANDELCIRASQLARATLHGTRRSSATANPVAAAPLLHQR